MDGQSGMPTSARIRKALLLTFGERYLNVALNLLVTVISARVLAPEDFGIVAIGVALQFTIASIQDFGISNTLLLTKDLTRETLRTGTTIITAVSLLLCLLLVLAAHRVALHLSQSGLEGYILVLAAQTVIAGLGIVPATLLRRDMAFDKLAFINLTSGAVNGVTVLALAFGGFEHMSFALAVLAASAVNTVLACHVHGDIGIFRPTLARFREIVSFGFWIGLADSLARGQDLLLNIILGSFWSSATLGYFNRTNVLATMPSKLLMAGIAPVAASAFAAVARSGTGLAAGYLKALSYKAAILWPLIGLGVLLAQPIILVLLGGQWVAAVPVLQILMISQIFTPLTAFAFMTLSAVGGVRATALVGAVNLTTNLAFVFGAAPHGILAAATAIVAANAISSAFVLAVTHRYGLFAWSDLSRTFARCGSIALATVALPALLLGAVRGSFDVSIVEALALGLIGGAGWLLGLKLTQHALYSEIISMLEGAFARCRRHLRAA